MITLLRSGSRIHYASSKGPEVIACALLALVVEFSRAGYDPSLRPLSPMARPTLRIQE